MNQDISKFRLNAKEIEKLHEEADILLSKLHQVTSRIEELLSEQDQILKNLPDE